MKELFPLKSQKGFPGGSEVKASACNAEDLGLIPESERSPGEGNGNPLQYSCPENPMDGGAWWSTVHGVAKNQILLSNLTNLKVKKDYESTHKNDLFFSFIMNYLTKRDTNSICTTVCMFSCSFVSNSLQPCGL